MTYPHQPPDSAMRPPQWQPGPGRPLKPAERFRVADIVLTAILVLGMIAVSCFTLIMVLLSPMVTDSCFDDCDMGTINTAWATMILSVPVAFLLVTIGIVWSAVKRQFMFLWPLLGGVVIGVVTLIAVQVMEGAAGM